MVDAAINDHLAVSISIFLFVHIGFAQLLDKLEFVRMRAAQYLPPGGKGDREAVDEEWRHLPIRNAVN